MGRAEHALPRFDWSSGNATVLRSRAIHGRISDAQESSLREGWLLLLNEALRAHCEQR
jgi:hypothetical protein